MSKKTQNGGDETAMVKFENFAIATIDPEELRAIAADNLDGDEIGITNLPRVRIPAGGGQMWEITDPDSGEPDSIRNVTGVIVAMKNSRAYWKERGTGQPPDCRCDNYRYSEHNTGIGEPGGNCDKCPLSTFGSARDDKGQAGKGQACKMMKLIFMLRENDTLPLLLIAPPTSLKPTKNYLTALTASRKSVKSVITEIGLEKVTGAANPYSIIKLRRAGELTPDQTAVIRKYADTMAATFRQSTVQAGDYDTAEPDFTTDENGNLKE